VFAQTLADGLKELWDSWFRGGGRCQEAYAWDVCCLLGLTGERPNENDDSKNYEANGDEHGGVRRPRASPVCTPGNDGLQPSVTALCAERLGAERPALAASTSRGAIMPGRSSGLLGRFAASGILLVMTRALDAVVAKLAMLSPEEQDRIAQWLLEELRDDEHWTRQFADSQDALSKLAAEARADLAAGRATDLDPDKL
jgi:hypothetical protein